MALAIVLVVWIFVSLGFGIQMLRFVIADGRPESRRIGGPVIIASGALAIVFSIALWLLYLTA